jgi:hypothetical protein
MNKDKNKKILDEIAEQWVNLILAHIQDKKRNKKHSATYK